MPTEQQILKEIRKIIPNSKKYLFDDCAIIEKNLVITSDTIVQDIHFDLKNYTPSQIGWKAMAVNLSDIASMGAKPLYAMVSLSLPKHINLKFIKELYKGIQSCAKKYKTQIIGGNLTGSKEISITITLMGKTSHQGVST
jgi:thiamine-monophosphate kinase